MLEIALAKRIFIDSNLHHLLGVSVQDLLLLTPREGAEGVEAVLPQYAENRKSLGWCEMMIDLLFAFALVELKVYALHSLLFNVSFFN